MEVLVLFDYDGQADDELTIRKGDVILEVKKQDGGWWEGLLGSKRGVFPDNFVTVVSEAEMSNPLIRTGPGKGRRCKVLFSYHPTHEDELALLVGDEIQLLGEVEEGWWRGRLAGKIGVFPSNFVSVVEESPSTEPNEKSSDVSSTPVLSTPEPTAPKLPPKPVRDIARVLYGYTALQPDELELKEGDMITILFKDCEDKGWWKGELNGKIGVFPDNFVELVSQSSSSSETSSINGQTKPERPPPIPTLSPVSSSKTATPQFRASLHSSSETATKTQPSIDVFDKNTTTNGNANPSVTPSNSLSDEQKLLRVGNESVDFSAVIKPTEILTHPARVKPAKRRPPSIFVKEPELNGGPKSPGLNGGGSSTLNEEPDSAMPAIEPAAQREPSPIAKNPVVIPPWMEELKKNQEKRVGGTVKTEQDHKPFINSIKPAAPKADARPTVPSHPKPVLLTERVASNGFNNITKNNSIKSVPASATAVNDIKNIRRESPPELIKPTSLRIAPTTSRSFNETSPSNPLPASLLRREMSPKPDGDVYEELVGLRHRVCDLEGTVQSLRHELLELKKLVENVHVLHL